MGNISKHDYVDLGLPSGLKWATMNVGANSITDTGLYFQWGDTQGYTADQVGSGEGQKNFGWEDYKYSNLNDDAVQTNWGGEWRMPTKDEFKELSDNCNKEWVTNYNDSGVNGILFTSRINGKCLFFPACGHCSYGSVYYVGSSGHYWSSSLLSSSVQSAYNLGFYYESVRWQNYDYRCYGFPIRGVVGE